MSARSKIEWTDASWTPIRARYLEIQNDGSGKERIGWHCEHVSEGCRNCYSEAMNLRLGTGRDFKPGELYREERAGYCNGESKVFLDENMLLAPLRWKRPRKIFVCSMTDLFADFIKDEWIDRIFAVMALCPQHTFQVLTKRPERMREYIIKGRIRAPSVNETIPGVAIKAQQQKVAAHSRAILDAASLGLHLLKWPLPNVWLGTSCEDQPTADERIPHLLATPGEIRFLSCEPLLGPLELGFREPCDHVRATCEEIGCWRGLDWIICGGESGPNARPMHPDWARSLRDQCAAAGVPFFFKQWGEWEVCAGEEPTAQEICDDPEVAPHDCACNNSEWMRRIGKSHAGRLLDGVEHNGFPRTAT